MDRALRRQAGADAVDIDTLGGVATYVLVEPRAIDFAPWLVGSPGLGSRAWNLHSDESYWTYFHEEYSWLRTIQRKPVVLHFEAEKLARWEVLEPLHAVSSGYDALDALQQRPTLFLLATGLALPNALAHLGALALLRHILLDRRNLR